MQQWRVGDIFPEALNKDAVMACSVRTTDVVVWEIKKGIAMRCLQSECAVELAAKDIPVQLCPRHYFSYFIPKRYEENIATEQGDLLCRATPTSNASVAVTIPSSQQCNRMLNEGISGTVGSHDNRGLWIYGWYSRSVQST